MNTRTIIGAFTAVVFLMAAGLAQAETWRGTLEAVDEEAGTFTVTGMEFVADEEMFPELEDLGIGQDIVVDYEMVDDENVATAVRRTSD